MPDAPSIPVIDSSNASQLPSIASVLASAGISSPISVPTAATSTVHAPVPHLPTNRTSAPLEMQNVTSGTAMDKKRARTHNNWSSVANSINSVISAQKNKHIEEVTHQVTTIMNAQQQIDNANQIINAPKGTYSDADIKNATSVRDKNMGLANRMLENPKTRKNFQKAFDVSFTDPSKNDTPEVKAMIAARTEFEKSKQSGLNVDNPEEQRVQILANGGSAPNTGAANNQQNVDTAHKSGLNVRGVDAPRETAGTSYADQFMKQIPTQLAQNPAYAAAMKQREEQMKAAQKIAPSVINQTGANERNAASNATRSADNAASNARALQVGRERNAAMLKATYARTSTEIKKTKMQIDSREKVAFNKGTPPKDQATILTANVTKLVSDINNLNKINTSLESQKAAILSHKNGDKETEALTEIDRQLNENKQNIQDFNEKVVYTNARLGELAKGGINGDNTNGNQRGQESSESENNTTDGNSTGSDEDSNDELSDLEHN